jgi:hypothetical protein
MPFSKKSCVGCEKQETRNKKHTIEKGEMNEGKHFEKHKGNGFHKFVKWNDRQRVAVVKFSYHPCS